MKDVISNLNYIFDKIVDLIKFIVDSSKLTIKKLKLLFFLGYMTFFSFNYFIDFKIEDKKSTFRFDPKDVPTSIVIITAILIIFLIVVDVIDNHVKMARLSSLAKSPQLPLELKNKAIDELIKTK